MIGAIFRITVTSLGIAIMMVLRRNINEDLCPDQLELIETLFCGMGCSPTFRWDAEMPLQNSIHYQKQI